MSPPTRSWDRPGAVQGWSQLCWPWQEIYSPVNTPGMLLLVWLLHLAVAGHAGSMPRLFLSCQTLHWSKSQGKILARSRSGGTHLPAPAPATPQGLSVPSPWAGRGVPGGRTGWEQGFALPSSWFQAPGLHLAAQLCHGHCTHPGSSPAGEGPATKPWCFVPGEGWRDPLRPNSHKESFSQAGSAPGPSLNTRLGSTFPNQHPEFRAQLMS